MALARRSVLRKDKTGQALLRQKLGALAKEMGFKWPLGTSSACLLCAIMHADVRVRGLPVPACGAAGPARTRRVRGGTGTYGYGAVRVRVLCHSKAPPGPVPVSTRTRKDPYKI